MMGRSHDKERRRPVGSGPLLWERWRPAGFGVCQNLRFPTLWFVRNDSATDPTRKGSGD
jgi:hypothetical protein